MRAGSNALKLALIRLGYGRIYSMGRAVQYYSHLRKWLQHARGEAPLDFARFFARWDVAKAHPAMFFPEEMIAAFPDVKVILLQREAGPWFRSYQGMVRLIGGVGEGMWFVPRLRLFHRLVETVTFAALGPATDGGERDFVAAHERIYARVEALLPPEQILRYDPADGWGPLCAFLGVEAPDEPFPRTNRRQSAIKGALARGLARDAGWLAAAAAILTLAGPSPLGGALLAGEAALFGLLYALRRA